MRAMKGRIMGLGVAVIFGSAVLAVMGLATEFEPAAQPTPIAFTEVCGQAPGVLVESDSVSITGINAPVPIAVINGEYSINGSGYTAEPGEVAFGQTVSVRHHAATEDGGMTSTILHVGGIRAVFSSNTGPCLRGTR